MALWTGSDVHKILELHEKYGPVVRTAPRQVSYTDASAWKTIYGHKTGGKTKTFEKDPKLYITDPTATRHIVIADDASHTRQRRILANSFSDKVCGFEHFFQPVCIESFPGTSRSGAFAQAMDKLHGLEVEGDHGCW